MSVRSILAVTVLCASVTTAVVAQSASREPALPDLAGTWEAETPDGPKHVIVRPDSSASFGEETVRWRLEPGVLWIAFGDEWVGYTVVVRGNRMTLSDGDLEEPISLARVGPPTPRPPGVEVPPAPPFKPGTTG